MKINSETVTNERTLGFYLVVDEVNEITSATYQSSLNCRECGEPAIVGEGPEDQAYCEEHPSAIIDSIVGGEVPLSPTPTGIGENGDTDVVFFTPDSPSLSGSFGLQIKTEGGGLKAICDLDGEVLSSTARWIVPSRVPTPIAEYAQSVCA